MAKLKLYDDDDNDWQPVSIPPWQFDSEVILICKNKNKKNKKQLKKKTSKFIIPYLFPQSTVSAVALEGSLLIVGGMFTLTTTDPTTNMTMKTQNLVIYDLAAQKFVFTEGLQSDSDQAFRFSLIFLKVSGSQIY